jgi:hypothetical protein
MAMRSAYLKYGVPVPQHIDDAAEMLANGTNQASVPVRPVKGDVEYLINVTVGNHVLSLDMDTGSSDLYVHFRLSYSSSFRKTVVLAAALSRMWGVQGSSQHF